MAVQGKFLIISITSFSFVITHLKWVSMFWPNTRAIYFGCVSETDFIRFSIRKKTAFSSRIKNQFFFLNSIFYLKKINFWAINVETGVVEAQVEKNEKEKRPGTDSPRGVLEIPVTGTDSDSSSSSCGSSSSPEKSTPQRAVNRESGGWKSMIDSIKKKSVVRRFSVIPLLTNYELTKKNLWKKLGRLQIPGDDDADDGGSVPIVRHSWKNFDFAELAAATDNFNSGEL